MKRSFLLAALTMLVIVGGPITYSVWSKAQTRNLRAVTPQVLYRSGQMTPRGFERTLHEYGIRTVISFRDSYDADKPPPDEHEDGLCQQQGIGYHRLVPQRWSAPDGSVPAQANVNRFLKIVQDPATPRPILVHCFAGVHRTGAFVALYRIQCEGWSNADAIREMLAIGGLRKSFEGDQIDYLNKFQQRK